MSASNYLETKVLNHVLTTTAYTAPTTRYLALFTSNPSGQLEAGTLTYEISTSGTAYARQAITFAVTTGNSISNNNAVSFPIATSNWGTITHVAVMDALTGGNVLVWGAVTTPKTINNGDGFVLNTGNLTITLD